MLLRSQSRNFVITLSALSTLATGAAAQNIKIVDSKDGSQLVYGDLDVKKSDQALTYLLKMVHGHYSSKPELCGIFSGRTGDSLGTFFSVVDNRFTHKKISGLALVEKGTDGAFHSAILTDQSTHFMKSLPNMVKTLGNAWNVQDGPSVGGSQETAQAAPAQTAPAQPLQPYRFPDGSGVVGLAPGWRPLVARGGGVIAAGPRGETMGLSAYLAVQDPRSPQIQGMLRRGGPLPGHFAVVSPGSDPASTFGQLYNQWRQKWNMPTGSVRVTVVNRKQIPGGSQFTVAGDFQNQQGPQHIVGVMWATQTPRLQGWSCTMSTVTAPTSLFDQESQTLFAMSGSLNQNAAQIQHQADLTCGALQQYGQSVIARGEEQGREHDEQHRQYYAGQDDRARGFQAFSNLFRDQSVVEHIPTGAGGTLSNGTASMLVDGDPQNWRYLPTNEFVKGRDF